MLLLSPQSFTATEIEGARQIRNRIKTIPPEFDTDFYLARWWRSYNGDIRAIERRMKELFDHRRAIGYDRTDAALFETEFDFARKTFERFSISPIVLDQHSGNIFVFVQKLAGTDLKEIVKVLPLSYVLHSYFMLHESFTRSVLAKEAATGSPSAVVSIVDLEGLNLADFINPLSSPVKLSRLAVKIWADYFGECVIKVYLINPPALLNVMWQIAKVILDKKTQSRITFLDKPADLLKHLSPKAVPEEYGGNWRGGNGQGYPSGSVCRKLIKVTPHQYYDINELWRRNGFEELPEVSTMSLKGKRTFEVVRHCEDGQSLLWHFTVNGDIEFDVVRIDETTEAIVWPKITLTSLKAPEQGILLCSKGEYRVRFTNPNNSWIPLKLHFVIETSLPRTANV